MPIRVGVGGDCGAPDRASRRRVGGRLRSVFGFFLIFFFKSADSRPAFQLRYSGLEGGDEPGHCLGEGGLNHGPLVAV
jgi:hypothetical protein